MPQSGCLVFGGLAVALAAIGAELHPASAHDAETPGGMQFFVTPYLWLSGIDATTKTPLPREAQVNSDVSAIRLLSHLSGVPFMGSTATGGISTGHKLSARPATALTLRGAASQIATIEIRLHPAAIQNANE
jgi:hypothetical protein